MRWRFYTHSHLLGGGVAEHGWVSERRDTFHPHPTTETTIFALAHHSVHTVEGRPQEHASLQLTHFFPTSRSYNHEKGMLTKEAGHDIENRLRNRSQTTPKPRMLGHLSFKK